MEITHEPLYIHKCSFLKQKLWVYLDILFVEAFKSDDGTKSWGYVGIALNNSV
jgi:hypothetical protein